VAGNRPTPDCATAARSVSKIPAGRDSPSGGGRKVYAEMGTDTRTEGDAVDCPSCGYRALRLASSWFNCEDHGALRAVA